jgi:hypothetical protein
MSEERARSYWKGRILGSSPKKQMSPQASLGDVLETCHLSLLLHSTTAQGRGSLQEVRELASAVRGRDSSRSLTGEDFETLGSAVRNFSVESETSSVASGVLQLSGVLTLLSLEMR